MAVNDKTIGPEATNARARMHVYSQHNCVSFLIFLITLQHPPALRSVDISQFQGLSGHTCLLHVFHFRHLVDKLCGIMLLSK